MVLSVAGVGRRSRLQDQVTTDLTMRKHSCDCTHAREEVVAILASLCRPTTLVLNSLMPRERIRPIEGKALRKLKHPGRTPKLWSSLDY